MHRATTHRWTVTAAATAAATAAVTAAAALALVTAPTALAAAPSPHEQAPLDRAQLNQAWDVEATRAALYQLLDASRATAGLVPLRRDAAVEQVAQDWTLTMAATGVLAHDTDLAQRLPAGWAAAGEDVGVMSGTTPTALVQAWLASPEHRANLLSPVFDQVGIGVAVGARGQVFVTADLDATA